MTRKQRTVIEKCDRVLVFVDDGCRNFAGHNSTEQTVIVSHETPFYLGTNARAATEGRPYSSYNSAQRFVEAWADETARVRKTFFQTMSQAFELQYQRHDRIVALC